MNPGPATGACEERNLCRIDESALTLYPAQALPETIACPESIALI
jgi:hypothetical protein